jgi:hypothetical protein
MRIEGAWGLASYGREELGLILVKDKVPDSSPVGGDRLYHVIDNENWWVKSFLNKFLIFNF